jgi:hypothetical protein
LPFSGLKNKAAHTPEAIVSGFAKSKGQVVRRLTHIV